METVQAAIFIPLMIIAITQIIKMYVPAVKEGWTILTALAVGVLTALLDRHIGLADINVAQGLVCALGAIGITTAFSKGGGGTAGDPPKA